MCDCCNYSTRISMHFHLLSDMFETIAFQDTNEVQVHTILVTHFICGILCIFNLFLVLFKKKNNCINTHFVLKHSSAKTLGNLVFK